MKPLGLTGPIDGKHFWVINDKRIGLDKLTIADLRDLVPWRRKYRNGDFFARAALREGK
jgi:hypothetical protein